MSLFFRISPSLFFKALIEAAVVELLSLQQQHAAPFLRRLVYIFNFFRFSFEI